jgi:SNF2 family DNA or RNA helicase
MNTVQTERGLDGSECATIRSTLKFLDPQITAAAFMLQRSYGRVPVLNQYDDQEYDQKLVQSGPRTFGGILADSMGMGKTLIANLYLSIAMKSHTTMKGRLHRPTLLIVPGGPVLQQWAKMLQDYFSELNVIQAYGDRPKDGRAALNWVGNIAMKSAPLDLTVWPKHLQYIFKKTDPKADSTIVLTGYDTWVQRTVKTEIRTRKQPNGEEVKYPFYWTDWPNVFDTVIMDEGHRLKNEITRTFLAIDQLDADYHWFLTATPSSNTLAVSQPS